MSISRWFRLYAEMLDDPKVQRLSPALFKTWVNLLCLASATSGKLPKSIDDIAYRLRLSIHDAGQQIDDLILAGLVDISPNGTREMHNWSARQFISDKSVERVRKHREKKRNTECNVTVTATVTAPEQNRTDSDTDSETEKGENFDEDFGSEIGREEQPSVQPIDPRLIARAEGLGLDVDELIATVARSRPRDPSALLQSLVRKNLRGRLPGLTDAAIGRALCGDAEAYGTLQQLMTMEATDA